MRKLIALAVLAASAACSLNTDNNTGPLAGDLSGTYNLQSMNGTALPFSIVSHDTTVLIDKDVLILNQSGAWGETVNYRQTVGANPSTNESFTLNGQWVRSGNRVEFRLDQGPLYSGVATDSTLALTDFQFNYLFKR